MQTQISFFFIILVLLTSGCSSLHTTSKQDLYISWQEPQKFHFQGKGAGAGMALMSTMGAMGMAIGVAIDEGIAKDIRTAQKTSGKSIEDLLEDANSDTAFRINWHSSNTTLPNIKIERIVFNITRGENDATEVKIQALYTGLNGKETRLNYPIENTESKIISTPLEQLKTNQDAANQLLIEGFKAILNSINDQSI